MSLLVSYDVLRGAVTGEPLPSALVLLDAFDRNVDRIAERAKKAKKTVRIATKSLRVPLLLRRALERGGPTFKGLLCYSAREAAYLVREGFSDIVLAYPPAPDEWALLADLAAAGTPVTAMVDSVEHCAAARTAAEARHTTLPIAIDCDASFRPFGALLHLGVRRSPLRSPAELNAVIAAAQESPALRLEGLMAYEAQLAGVGDRNPFHPIRSLLLRFLKPLFRRAIARERKEVAQLLVAQGVELRFFNGGGSGSLGSSLRDRTLTEITVGSGLLQSHLFDYYDDATCEPALFFALPVTRVPDRRIVTCQSGGYIASGAPGADRLPLPCLPAGLRFLADEGAGEVQTPLRLPRSLTLEPGDPVFFRPAKTGELAERFAAYLAIREGRMVTRLPTYRGLGQCFP